MKFEKAINEKKEKKVDYKTVLGAAKKAAKSIHGDADMKIVRSMVSKAVKAGKDTEDAIQISVNMLRQRD